MTLFAVTSDKVDAVWPHIEHFIMNACEKGPCRDLVPDELRVSCETMRHQLWVALGDDHAPVAACVTGIREDNGRRVAEWVAFGANDANCWQEYTKTIEQWAKNLGCVAFRSFSRPGIKRIMPAGYKVKGYIFEKVL